MGQLLSAKISVNVQIVNVSVCRLPYIDNIMEYKAKILVAFLLIRYNFIVT